MKILPIVARMSKTYAKDRIPPKQARNFKNYTNEWLVSNLEAIDWTDVYEEQDINVVTTALTSKITSVLNRLCPMDKITSNNHHRKFVSTET